MQTFIPSHLLRSCTASNCALSSSIHKSPDCYGIPPYWLVPNGMMWHVSSSQLMLTNHVLAFIFDCSSFAIIVHPPLWKISVTAHISNSPFDNTHCRIVNGWSTTSNESTYSSQMIRTHTFSIYLPTITMSFASYPFVTYLDSIARNILLLNFIFTQIFQ